MAWKYTKRDDGRIAVTLDNNTWDFLFAKKVDLLSELPPDEFAIFIPREVEIETMAIPDEISKALLRVYIAETTARCGIITTATFGFATPGPGPQRVAGFDQGTWQSETERDFYAAIRQRFLVGKSQKKSQLSDNEADAALGARSFSSIVLTCEKREKVGPLRFATEHGGKVLYLRDFDQSGQTLKEYIAALYRKI